MRGFRGRTGGDGGLAIRPAECPWSMVSDTGVKFLHI